MMEDSGRGSWKSRTGFLMAIIGSAIGLGNIWRFPYMAYRNGGGAFLIPYVIALFTLGIPLMILELAIGHRFRASAPLALSRIGRRWEFLGWWMVIFAFVGIEFYYCVVVSWCIDYFWYAFGLRWGTDTGGFFENTFLRLSPDPYLLGGFNKAILAALLLVWIVNWWIVYRGIRKGIELASKILIPFLGLIMLVLVVWSATLPGAATGIKAYLSPDFSMLLNPDIWTNAFSQIFFTLSLGFGIVIAYSSYLPSKTNIKSNAVITCICNCGFSIVAGFAVFATLGYMSHVSGEPIGEVVRGGPGLTFITYPATINLLPFGKKIFGMLFFLSLIFAGIASSISIFEAMASSLIDKFGYSRKKVTTWMAVIGFGGSLIFTTGAGLYWLDVVDYFLNNLGLLTAALLEAIAIGWVYKASKLREHVNQVGRTSCVTEDGKRRWCYLGKWWEYIIMIWIPFILGLLVVLELLKQILSPYSGYKWVFVIPVGFGWIVMTLLIAWFFKRRAWRIPKAKEASL